MTKKIFRSIFIVSLAALLSCIVIVTGVLYEYFTSIQKSRLKTEMSLASTGVEQSGLQYLNRVNPDEYRLTLIDTDGSVIFDSVANPSEMENHADREEIKEALTNGTGESERYSTTLIKKTLYYAARLSDGTVLRVSIDSMTVISLVFGMLQPICVLLLVVLILAGILANRMAKHIVKPLNELDLENPLETDAYEELSPLLRRINQLHTQVTAQMRELKRKKDEFAQITGSMREGLVLLDNNGTIISINNSAMKLFHTNQSCIGADFYTVERNHEISKAYSSAINNGHGEIGIERDGREYQFEISRIESDDTVIGAVLLTFDVTDKVFAERNRREFTANVSHELKTPLQTIMGGAELIENGLVKPEDMKRFVSHIRSEAARLVALIEDIIRLSQLDEKNDLPIEDVDLYKIASEIKDELQYAADTKKISLSISGKSTVISGANKLLTEVIFNLCDNAIKYNHEGGSVNIEVQSDDNKAILTVSDTGIGIPPEHQDRVFERFYRVDKSHSKESGGTGLGLSIVKHAVQLHNGTITLESTEGKGSHFTITFPTERINEDL